eukprot:1145378-Pelagomonas_calceolata.AAC.6
MIVVRDDRRVVRGKMREQEVGKGRRTGGANSYSIQAYVFHMLPDSLGCHGHASCGSVDAAIASCMPLQLLPADVWASHFGRELRSIYSACNRHKHAAMMTPLHLHPHRLRLSQWWWCCTLGEGSGHTLDSTNSAIPVLFSKAMNKTMTNPIPSNPLLKSKRHAENCVPALLPQDPHEDPLPHDLPLLTTHLEKESFKLL